MADTSLIIGNGNWAVKETSLLGYNIIQSKYVPIEMTVSRNTTGTRVNSAGFIEVVPINLLTYSNDLTNPIWTKTNTTIALNTIANPLNGLVNGQIFTPNTTNGDHIVYGSGTTIAGQSYVISFFVKANGYTNCRVGNAASGLGVWFNLSNGTVISGTGGTITPLSNGWYLASYLLTAGGTLVNPLISFAPSTSTNFAGNGISGGYVFGAQLETGTTATEYIPTTDRFNIPRVDYLNSITGTLTTGSLLVEPTRTNLVPDGLLFNVATGVSYNTTVIDSPAIGINSARITKSVVSASDIYASQNCSTAALLGSTTYTISRYFKYDGHTITTSMQYNNSFQWGTTSWSVPIIIASTGVTLGTSTSCTSTIQNAGNSWYRVNVTITTGAVITGASPTYLMILQGALSVGQGFLTALPQLEVGSNSTSYIPTTTTIPPTLAGVTRVADVITKTGISSLIGQSEGTIYVEFNNTLMTYAVEGYLIRIFADANNEVWIRKEQGSSTYSARWKASGTDVYTQLNIPVINGNNKIAFAYKSADSIVYLNGVPITTPTGTLSGVFSVAPSIIAIGSSSTINFFNDRIKSATVFKTRLINSELQTLTA